MNYNLLKFLNHSSYLLESEKHILICDPWYEGAVFFEGWDLVSKEFSNKDVIEYLVSQNKKIHIWYSHEHPDHFSINFLNDIEEKHKKLFNFYYKKTTDQRVVNFLKKKNFEVHEATIGENIVIENNFNFRIYNYKNSDDSFSITNFLGKKILNLNDCTIKNNKDCIYISKLIKFL